jgi:hypothetical protein
MITCSISSIVVTQTSEILWTQVLHRGEVKHSSRPRVHLDNATPHRAVGTKRYFQDYQICHALRFVDREKERIERSRHPILLCEKSPTQNLGNDHTVSSKQCENRKSIEVGSKIFNEQNGSVFRDSNRESQQRPLSGHLAREREAFVD